MSSVNFYLKEPSSKEETPIFLQFKYNGKRFKYYIGHSIIPAKWDPKRQRVRNTNATTKTGDALLNDLINGLAQKVESTYKGAVSIPTPDDFRSALDGFRKVVENRGEEKIDLFGLIDRFCRNEILMNGRGRNLNTIKTYISTRNHLKAFVKATRYKVDFETINLDFYYRFVNYLKDEGLSANTIGKYLKNIKTFMGEAVEMELTDNLQYTKKKFTIPREETFSVHLNESEIILLYNMDLSGKPRLQQVRDLFVFGCFVGLRFSDFSDVRPENIVEIDMELYLRIKTKKMGNRVTIPCNPIVREIFSRYDSMHNKLPR